MPKIIKFYRKSQYGQDREFVHPDNFNDATFISSLTNQKTISNKIRSDIENLFTTDGIKGIQFQEVIAP